MMEGAPARTFVERRFIGTVTDQIEALLIFEHSPNAAAEIVRVANRDAPGLLREKVQALLRIERLFTTVGHLLAQIISAAAARRIERPVPEPVDEDLAVAPPLPQLAGAGFEAPDQGLVLAGEIQVLGPELDQRAVAGSRSGSGVLSIDPRLAFHGGSSL